MSTNDLLLIGFLLICILPLIITAVGAFLLYRFGKRQYDELVSTDAEKLYNDYLAMYQQNPNVDTAVLVKKIVNRQAFKCGVVGGITGLGGLFTLPLSLPIDLFLSARLQASMVEFMARAYGQSADAMDTRVATYAILAGGDRITRYSVQYGTRLLTRITGKTLSKFIPFIGALLSFGINYMFAQSTARVAMRWYGARLQNGDGTSQLTTTGEAST